MRRQALITLGNNVRLLRLERGLSQEKLAERADLHTNYVGGIERGERNPGFLNLLMLSKALNCPIQVLFKGTEKIALKKATK